MKALISQVANSSKQPFPQQGMAPRVPASQGEGLVTGLPLRSHLSTRSRHSGDAEGLDIKPIFHLVFIPLVLLTPRDLQSGFPLLPFHHKSAATVLSYEPIFTHLLWLTLKFIVCAESIQIRCSAVGLVGPAKLTHSEEAIQGQMMNLKVKLLKHLAKELDGR